MDVFLVPVAPDRYELYCEEPDEPEPPAEDGAAPPGFFRRTTLWFREQLAEAERARRHGPQPGDARRSLLGRARARSMRWIAESIAEQRLLWQLRGKDEVLLLYPLDITEEQANKAARETILISLAALRAEIGSLDRVKRIVKLTGWVNSAPGFTRQPWVINGASDLLVEIFGEAGKHARSSIGANELPLNIPVEIELVVEVLPER